tara:strand:- start:3527 stop:4066 length:540 start_codon:yes stop_codon:yes gene_type:complete
MLNVNTFKSKIIEKGGILDNNRFKVILPQIDGSTLTGEDLNLFCISVDMPGRQITTQPRRIGLKEEKVADGFLVDDVNISFYMPADGSIKQYFETWAQKAVLNVQGRIGYKVDYQKNVMIQQLKRDESVSHQVLLREAFPTSLQAIELSSETTNQLSRYSVQLSYTDFLPSRPALEAAI